MFLWVAGINLGSESTAFTNSSIKSDLNELGGYSFSKEEYPKVSTENEIYAFFIESNLKGLSCL